MQSNPLRLAEKNNSTRRRRIWVRLQGASAGAYLLYAGGCNAVDGHKDKQDGGIIFFRQPKYCVYSSGSIAPSALNAGVPYRFRTDAIYSMREELGHVLWHRQVFCKSFLGGIFKKKAIVFWQSGQYYTHNAYQRE
jgi:hypothetical protein